MSTNLASLKREQEENINKACVFFHVGLNTMLAI